MTAERALVLILAAAGAAGCARGAAPDLGELSDEPQTAVVSRRDLPQSAPAYGIAIRGTAGEVFEATVEAADAGKIRDGQEAVAYALPSTAPVSCRVERVMRDASAETGQAIVWLKPVAGDPVPANDFVYVRIAVGVRRGVPTVPRGAIMVRGGRTMVVRRTKTADGKSAFEPVPVEIGLVSGGSAEIRSGAALGDQVVATGGIGLLDPDFKASGGD